MSFLVALPENQYRADAFDAFAPDAGFALGNARAMAWAAQLAYEADEPEKARRVLTRWGFDEDPATPGVTKFAPFVASVASVLPLATTSGYVALRRGTVILAFEGTDPLVLANWISDFDAVAFDGLHEGFERAIAVAWPQVEAILKTVLTPERRLVVTGHSLGGALAFKAAARLADDARMLAQLAGVYTYGAPRVGDARFARDYDARLGDRTFRLVYGSDIVPTVPPAGLGFVHVGLRLPLGPDRPFDPAALAADNEPRKPAGAGLPPALAGLGAMLKGSLHEAAPTAPTGRPDLLGRIFDVLPPSIRDHLPDRYCGALA